MLVDQNEKILHVSIKETDKTIVREIQRTIIFRRKYVENQRVRFLMISKVK